MIEEKKRFFTHDEVDHAREKISKNRKKLYVLAITVIVYFKNDLTISFTNVVDGSSGLGFRGIIFIDGIDDNLIILALSVSFLIVFARFIWFTLHFFGALYASKKHVRLHRRSSNAYPEWDRKRQGEYPSSSYEEPDDEGYGFLKIYKDEEKFAKRVRKLFKNYRIVSDVFFPHFIPFVLGVIASYFAVPHIVRQFLW